MHQRVFAAEVARALTARGHTNSLTGRAWRPGHRATQASPKTVRLWHDGPDEQNHLDRYAQALQAAGYTVTAEHPAAARPRLRITRQTKEP
ncbi:hypothetical protein [Streptomyces sp. Je 1-369]|uniref:hypothetical protein n=1 Tax=Streptomyces sp. Je 1-369 TaxID=2966192 RepID=UPI002286BF26|nr:hypothetical protein [Streptomyces sp. Je 1-369]WAL93954.1 hypothetical protein NOO62_05245 [Streptomyces sp. Je 1-369]